MKWHLIILLILFSANLYSKAPEKKVNKEQEDQKEDKNKDKKEDKKKEEKDSDEPLKVGNLALPTSQQPGPLISFGQNIINKGQAQTFLLSIDMAKTQGDYNITQVPSIVYAFTDDFSIFLNAPITPRQRQGEAHSSGFEDAYIQLEYAFYTKEHKTYIDQATIVANVTIPTGSTKKNPPTGIGANSFFLGGTFCRMTLDWFYFTSYAGIWTTSSHQTKFGNTFLYQYGIGKNITNIRDWLLCWMVELDGIYSCKDKIHGVTDPNSGGNVIYLTPSLWVSSEHLILQLGVGYAIAQQLNGDQNENTYLLALNLGWTF
jgi:hypothetical protein